MKRQIRFGGIALALAVLVLILLPCASAQEKGAAAPRLHHYVFFNRDRDRISEATFLDTKAFEGAQIKYTWRQLEHGKDGYDFGDIEHDLMFLNSKGKKLFIQIQDASFDPSIMPIPKYLRDDPQYHGGADPQYEIKNDDESTAKPAGWVARRWDPAVRARFQKLLAALGEKFDGRIEGINLPETAVDFGETGKLFPKGFTPENYRDGIISNMTALKKAFPKSVAMQYANFMPGDKNGGDAKSNLRTVFDRAKELKVGLGGPDLLPHRFWQMKNSYPLLREYSGSVPTGIAVQEGNYQQKNSKTGKRVTIEELQEFGREYLKVKYIFWCTQEPFYSKELIPNLQEQK